MVVATCIRKPGWLNISVLSLQFKCCFWQVGLAHFGGLIWPTPRDVKVERTEFRSAGA